ncbi:Uncharacterised protein [Burkholderia cepacia]|nr:putative membrane protein [Burkholderia cepacia ATCC 25416]SPU90234.1 Uncharacterised protein [Burkholderia cepacia]
MSSTPRSRTRRIAAAALALAGMRLATGLGLAPLT